MAAVAQSEIQQARDLIGFVAQQIHDRAHEFIGNGIKLSRSQQWKYLCWVTHSQMVSHLDIVRSLGQGEEDFNDACAAIGEFAQDWNKALKDLHDSILLVDAGKAGQDIMTMVCQYAPTSTPEPTMRSEL